MIHVTVPIEVLKRFPDAMSLINDGLKSAHVQSYLTLLRFSQHNGEEYHYKFVHKGLIHQATYRWAAKAEIEIIHIEPMLV